MLSTGEIQCYRLERYHVIDWNDTILSMFDWSDTMLLTGVIQCYRLERYNNID